MPTPGSSPGGPNACRGRKWPRRSLPPGTPSIGPCAWPSTGGLAHRDLTNIEAIGVDELSRRRGQRYLTLVYQIDGHCKRLLWVGRERKAATLEGFFDWFGAARSAALYFVCSDMWKPYLKVVAERAGQAVQVLDRFHIMSHFSQAIDEVRAAEARKLAAEGRAPVLKHSRWLLLKRPENLTDGQQERLAELVRRNLRTVRAYLLKEDFQSLWGYVSPYWAGRFLDRWCTRAMRSRLEPMKEVARMVRSHRDLNPELVPSPGAVLQRRCRRLQREGQSDHQTGVWVPHPPGHWKSLCITHLATCPEPERTHRFC